jgi:nucleoside-diphosphate-sugar epimerase
MSAAEPDSSRVLVTGGTGIIGGALVRLLVAARRPVRLLSRTLRSSAGPGIQVIRGDLTQPEDVREAIDGCCAVFHCAGEKHDSGKMLDINVLGTRVLFALTAERGIEFFCHLSSAGVVGSTDAKLVDERAACNPTNLYEETKLAAEEVVSRGLDDGTVVVLRPTNVFDARLMQSLTTTSLGWRLRLCLKGRENAHLVYVEDVAATAVRLFDQPRRIGVETFNVSSDDEPGNTHAEVQALIAANCSTAPRAPRLMAPLLVPRLLRLATGVASNSGAVVYSSGKLRALGIRFPYGLKLGVLDALRRRTG